MTRKHRLPFVLLVLAAAAVPVACASKAPPPPVVATPTDAGIDSEAGPVWGAMGATGADGGEAGAPDAGAIAPLPSASVNPAALNALADGAIDLAANLLAQKDAPGSAIEGQPTHATLIEGGSTSMIVTMQPGRCYTFIGFSPPGQVAQLELKLLAPPYTLEAGRSGANDKAAPVIGKGKAAMCPALPIPIPYRIDATAKKGAGRVGVYVYSKSK